MEQKPQGSSDEELCLSAAQGAPEAETELVCRYGWLVRACARPLFLAGGDSEDLIQEGMIGLFKAIRDYREGRDASFGHFADLCISRQIYHAVEASQRKKHQPLNSYISLNQEMGEEGTDTFLDLLESFDNANPEQLVIDLESTRPSANRWSMA